MAHALAHDRPAGLLLPALLLLGLLGAIGSQIGLIQWPTATTDPGLTPQTVTIAPRTYSYRATGDFVRGTATIDGPLVTVTDPTPLEIMKYQVSEADYARCVADNVCHKAEPRRRGEGNLPVTGVSFNDANDYAGWLSARTGATWRLPTVAEWSFAAGSKARDHALDLATSEGDPAERWLAYYEREAKLGAGAWATPSPIGAFGEHEYGVTDLGGTVWEWTATCGSRTTLDAAGKTLTYLDSCGVRLLEGRHRTPMSAFIRDAQGGGCAIGAPPDNLGFRLVREPGWWERVITNYIG